MKKVGKDKTAKLLPYQQVGIILLTWVFAGFFGWVYEFIFYYFDGGTGEFYMQGGNLLPWINIYAVGAILIMMLVQLLKLKKHPWLVFLVSVVATGLLEFVSGWLVYVIGNGTRYWDYNTEILNFGNIGGFVCLRSVLIFGVSALMLVYLVVPFFVKLAKKMSKRAFLILAISLFSIVMVDEIYNLLASKVFGWPDAMELYKSMGWKYLT
ncbi:putative ABC transporter permease [Candidatus Saccharibacteria bacterium]|nr:putative ABC transporter permease [Candidatus Saccharibacteria bacterium]